VYPDKQQPFGLFTHSGKLPVYNIIRTKVPFPDAALSNITDI